MVEQRDKRIGTAPSQELLDELEAHVESCLGGRIRDFHVGIQEGGLVLLGRTRSYHAKQLAQHHVMQMSNLPILANDIVVE